MSWLRTEGGAYWSVFVAAFLAIAVWESLRPRTTLSEPAERRWGKHLLLFLTSAFVAAVLMPLSPMLLAASVSGSRYGLLNKPWAPFAARFILAVLVLDLTRYASHRALHSISFLWRLHQIHHSDRDFDVSTGVRNHPLEGIFVRAVTLAVIGVLAPPVSAVLVAELASVFQTFFAHANAALPERLQRGLGLFCFTANTHRIHHSVDIGMQNRNYGDVFPWWDRIFGTYLPPLPAGQDRIVMGVAECQTGPAPGFVSLLKQPFAARQEDPSLTPSA